MKRNLVLSILIIFNIQLFSQKILFEKDITLNAFLKDKRESFPIVNDEKKEILLFLLDNNEINALRFSDNFELIDNYTTDRQANVLLSHNIDSKGYHLIFTNESKNEFYAKSFDMSAKQANGKQIALTLHIVIIF